MSNLISKSVRIPKDMVDFIERQEGITFSEKLLGVLDEYRNGDADRQKRLQEYEAQLESKRRTLRDYGSVAIRAAKVTQQLGATLSDIDKHFGIK